MQKNQKAKLPFQRNGLLLFAAIVLFSIICCLSQIVCSDDLVNYFYLDDPYSHFFDSGRYAAKYTGIAIICFPILRFFVYTLILALYLWFAARFMQFGKKQYDRAWMTFAMFALMPPPLFKSVIMWLGAYSTYVPPMVLIMLYLHLTFQEFSGKPAVSKLWIPACAVISAVTVLYAEHTAIYCCVLAVFVLLWSGFRKNLKIRVYQITYAIGAISGTVFMLLNPIYQVAKTGDDAHTLRSIEYNPLDILMKIYTDVVPHFCEEYWVINLVIAFSLAVLYFYTDRSQWNQKRRLYSKLSLGCVLVFAVYSFMNADFAELTPIIGVRLRALETAMTFLDLISAVYLGYLLLEKKAYFRVIVFLCSAILVSAPFGMVNPVTERCFFANFTFWLLAASEIFGQTTDKLSANGKELLHRAAAVLGAGSICFISYINIINRWSNSLTISFLKEQLAQGRHTVDVIDEPYPDYTKSDISSYLQMVNHTTEHNVLEKIWKADDEEMYSYFFLKYYDITINDPDQLRINEITLADYFT